MNTSISNTVAGAVNVITLNTTEPKQIASGYRKLVLNYRTVKETGIKPASKYGQVPVISKDEIAQNLDTLAPVLVNYLADIQDKIARELLGTADMAQINIADISISGIIEYLSTEVRNADGISVRLTKESITNWYHAEIADSLMLTVADKLSLDVENATPESIAKVKAISDAYCQKFGALASGRTQYTPVIATQLLKALQFASPDSTIATALTNRINKMMENKSDDLLSAL